MGMLSCFHAHEYFLVDVASHFLIPFDGNPPLEEQAKDSPHACLLAPIWIGMVIQGTKAISYANPCRKSITSNVYHETLELPLRKSFHTSLFFGSQVKP